MLIFLTANSHINKNNLNRNSFRNFLRLFNQFSNALMTYTVPLVIGFRSSYDRKMPGSFIHVNDFPDIASLAKHLDEIVENENNLLQYHKWRQYFYISDARLKDRIECQVCRKVAETRTKSTVSTIPDITAAIQNLQNCT